MEEKKYNERTKKRAGIKEVGGQAKGLCRVQTYAVCYLKGQAFFVIYPLYIFFTMY